MSGWLAELIFHQIVVCAAPLHQPGVVSDLNHPAAIEDDNLVGVPYSTQPVRRHDNRPIGETPRQLHHDLRFVG